MKKKFIAMLLASMMVFVMGTAAFASSGSWQYDGYGWWYAYDDGGYAANGWEYDNGFWYHFNGSGYMDTGWVWDNAWYYLNPDGTMATGWIWDGSSWYYMNPSGTMATGWVWDGSNWYYMNQSGAMVTRWVLYGDAWYYMNASGAMATGWVWDGSNWYYMNQSGAMAAGWVWDGSSWYYMNPNGSMATGWLYDESTQSWYYLQMNGAMATGITAIDGMNHVFNDYGVWLYESGPAPKEISRDPNREQTSNGENVKNDSNEKDAASQSSDKANNHNSTEKDEANTSQSSSETGAATSTGSQKTITKAESDASGKSTGTWTYGDNGWHTDKRFYFDSSGEKVSGWLQYNGNLYYLDETYGMATGMYGINDSWYLFREDGTMVTGWYDYQDCRYYLNTDGTAATGWKEIGGKRYYFSSLGEMQTGWQNLEDGTYYLGNDGVMQTGWMKDPALDLTRYLDINGKVVTGWKTIDSKKYYFNESGFMMADSWVDIDGTTYVFNADGTLHSHSYTSAVTDQAYCGHDGTRTYTCSCGDSYTETIPMPAPHCEYEDVENEYGTMDSICKYCGHTWLGSYYCGCSRESEYSRHDTVTVHGVEFCLRDWPSQITLPYQPYENHEDWIMDNYNLHLKTVYKNAANPADFTYTVTYPDPAQNNYLTVNDPVRPLAYVSQYELTADSSGYDGVMRVEVSSDYGTGVFDVNAYYKGEYVATCRVSITQQESGLTWLLDKVHSYEKSAGWNDSMDNEEKISALASWIMRNLTYAECTCKDGAQFIMAAAKFDLGIAGCRYGFSLQPDTKIDYWRGVAFIGGHTWIEIPMHGGYWRLDVQGNKEE